MTDDILQQAMLASMKRTNQNEALIANTAQDFGSINGTMNEHRTAAAHIRNNSHLTTDGQTAKLAMLAQQTAGKLSSIEDKLVNLTRRIAEETALLKPEVPERDATLDYLMLKEIRDSLVGVDELEIVARYLGHAEDGTDDKFMRAVELSPVQMITDLSILEKGKTARAERQSPERAQQVADLKSRRAALDAAYQSALAELSLPPDNAIERIAAGDAA